MQACLRSSVRSRYRLEAQPMVSTSVDPSYCEPFAESPELGIAGGETQPALNRSDGSAG